MHVRLTIPIGSSEILMSKVTELCMAKEFEQQSCTLVVYTSPCITV